MRVWYSGIMSAFQAEDAGSIPAIRSPRKRVLQTLIKGGYL